MATQPPEPEKDEIDELLEIVSDPTHEVRGLVQNRLGASLR